MSKQHATLRIVPTSPPAARRAGFAADALAGLSPSERELFHRFGQGLTADLPYQCVHHAFEEWARDTPYAIAVEHLGESISYQSLNRHANHLAQHLRSLGVRPGDHVGLFLHRSIPMVVGIMATLKCGAAYVPQHAGVAPGPQLRHVAEVANTRVVLTLSTVRRHLPEDDGIHYVEVDGFMQAGFGPEHDFDVRPEQDIDPDSSCFVLFTSGTTGMPNGVQVSHRNVCNILHIEPGSLGIQPGMRVSQLLSIAFDMAAWETLGCLSHGGTLVVRGRSIQEAARTVDVIIATPSILATIDPGQCRRVKVVAVAGEPCPRALADRWSAISTFFNSCGPTETTIVNTMQRYSSWSESLTIGKPTPNNTVYILDDQLRPLPIGEIGEMWAGGDCVTAGYLGNDCLSRERYRPDPFRGEGMMFRTRDLGRWTREGELEHHGRTDDQVKVRGFRVELDSVSRTIEALPECTHAVTLALDGRNLVSFVCPPELDPEAVQKAVGDELPYYCVPSLVVGLESLPLTSRGKADKRALRNILADSDAVAKGNPS